MRTIHKFPLPIAEGPQQIIMPADAVVRHVANQDGVLTLWAEVDNSRPPVLRDLCVVGTGWPIPDGFTLYHGTAGVGFFVWHVYGKGR